LTKPRINPSIWPYGKRFAGRKIYVRASALSTNFLPECRAIPRTISGLAQSEAQAAAPVRCLKCWQRRDGAPRWCGQKKAPTERGFSSYLEADPS